jgi:hypothetical protein
MKLEKIHKVFLANSLSATLEIKDRNIVGFCCLPALF